MAGIAPLGDGETAALDELCDDIVRRYHAAIRRDLPRIDGLLAAIEGSSEPATEVREVFRAVAATLASHLAKEENILFPALKALADAARQGRARPALPFPTLLHPIGVMETEHARVESLMERLRWLTSGFEPPRDAGSVCREAYGALADFDLHLTVHVRLENDVLFPRALELERKLES